MSFHECLLCAGELIDSSFNEEHAKTLTRLLRLPSFSSEDTEDNANDADADEDEENSFPALFLSLTYCPPCVRKIGEIQVIFAHLDESEQKLEDSKRALEDQLKSCFLVANRMPRSSDAHPMSVSANQITRTKIISQLNNATNNTFTRTDWNMQSAIADGSAIGDSTFILMPTPLPEAIKQAAQAVDPFATDPFASDDFDIPHSPAISMHSLEEEKFQPPESVYLYDDTFSDHQNQDSSNEFGFDSVRTTSHQQDLATNPTTEGSNQHIGRASQKQTPTSDQQSSSVESYKESVLSWRSGRLVPCPFGDSCTKSVRGGEDGEIFRNAHFLKEHKGVKECYVCNICEKGLTSYPRLQRHEKFHKSGVPVGAFSGRKAQIYETATEHYNLSGEDRSEELSNASEIEGDIPSDCDSSNQGTEKRKRDARRTESSKQRKPSNEQRSSSPNSSAHKQGNKDSAQKSTLSRNKTRTRSGRIVRKRTTYEGDEAGNDSGSESVRSTTRRGKQSQGAVADTMQKKPNANSHGSESESSPLNQIPVSDDENSKEQAKIYTESTSDDDRGGGNISRSDSEESDMENETSSRSGRRVETSQSNEHVDENESESESSSSSDNSDSDASPASPPPKPSTPKRKRSLLAVGEDEEMVAKRPKATRKRLKKKNETDEGDAVSRVSCPIEGCWLKFKPDEEYRRQAHVRRIHEGIYKCYVCEICAKSYGDDRGYRKHLVDNHGATSDLVCEYCGQKDFPSRDRLKLHLLVEHEPHNIRHRCDVCAKVCTKASRLITHIRCHSNERPFTCLICGQTFGHLKNLKDHANSHPESASATIDGGPNCFQCPHCSKQLSSYWSLQTHISRVHDKKCRFNCEVCGSGFISKSELRRHAVAKHWDEGPCAPTNPTSAANGNEIPIGKMPPPLLDPTDFGCNICMKTFPTKWNLEVHNSNEHGTVKNIFKCEVCGKVFIRQSDLNKHTPTHSEERPYLCEICSESFRSVQTLKYHLIQHEETPGGGKDTFKCPHCEKLLGNTFGLKAHIARVHEKNFKFACELCGFGTLSHSELQKHLTSMHTTERNFPCDQCPRAFKDKHKLKVHLKRHAGEKDHVCKSCGMAFFENRDLKYHEVAFHSEGPADHHCQICSKMFPAKKYEYHMKQHEMKKRSREMKAKAKLAKSSEMAANPMSDASLVMSSGNTSSDVDLSTSAPEIPSFIVPTLTV